MSPHPIYFMNSESKVIENFAVDIIIQVNYVSGSPILVHKFTFIVK